MSGGDYTQSLSAIRVWRVLQTGDYTLDQLAKRACVSRRSLHQLLAVFHQAGLVHLADWKRPIESQYQLAAVYRFGPGKNMPRPKRDRRDVGLFLETNFSVVKIAEALSICGPMTHHDVADEVGLAPEYARRLLILMAHKTELAHVSAWRKSTQSGQQSPLYSYGKGKNVPRPGGKTPAEISRAHRQKNAARFGDEIARRIDRPRSKGGPDVIVIDGKTVYRRRENRCLQRKEIHDAF